ncbi:MAG: saccharopine dehydrogenase NADP-binding domain-containing protein [Bacteroidia bacterium]|nr:saccharopine dehydrogenase NADP-binding domain-containing protein [Bacteroidia bacterium]
MVKGNIFIAGAGGIGRAAALLLETNEAMDATVFIGDISTSQLDSAIEWIASAFGTTNVTPVNMTDDSLSGVFDQCDVLLDCLPGSLAPKMAQYSIDHNMHYANLTEYVSETEQISALAKNASTGFVLQTGLAPGYINVLALRLYEEFKQDHNTDKLDSMQMKVGALSKNATSPHHYAFTWSPIGVATEYVKDAIVVRNNQRQLFPALSGRGLITIDGTVYEDNYTSGGAANLPSAFADKITNIDYKTLRYPGHYQWVEKTLSEIPISENRAKKLFDIMLETIPVVDDDVVIIYASVTGKDSNGFLRNHEKSLKVTPMKIGNAKLRAIQSTTAAPLCEMAYWLLKSKSSGVIYQTDIDTESFLNGPYVSMVYGAYTDL